MRGQAELLTTGLLSLQLNLNTYMPNVFEAFCLKAVMLLAPSGCLSLVVPDRIAANENYVNARKSPSFGRYGGNTVQSAHFRTLQQTLSFLYAVPALILSAYSRSPDGKKPRLTFREQKFLQTRRR